MKRGNGINKIIYEAKLAIMSTYEWNSWISQHLPTKLKLIAERRGVWLGNNGFVTTKLISKKTLGLMIF